MPSSEPNHWKTRFFIAIAVVGVMLYVVLSPWKMDIGWEAAPGGETGTVPAEKPRPAEIPEPQESTVYVTKTGERFHRGDCWHLKSKISIPRSEALSIGYTPCKVCRP